MTTAVGNIIRPKSTHRRISLTVVLLSLSSCIEADTSLISIQDRTKVGTSLFILDKKTEEMQAELTYTGNTQYLMQDNKNASLVSFRYVKGSKDKQFYLMQGERPQRSNLETTAAKTSKALHKFEIMPIIIDSQYNLTIGTVQCDSNAVASSKKNNINLECSNNLFPETVIVGTPRHDSLDCFFYDLFEGNSIKWDEAGTRLKGYKIPESTTDIQCRL